jgi:predicted benzoate:H+ symporter BenE
VAVSAAGLGFTQPSTSYTWGNVTSFVTGAIYTIGGLVIVGSLLVSGIMFATAGGDDDKLKTARTALIWAVAGIVVMVIAASIWGIIGGWLANT